jgi:uroporphyrinogen-III synthase
MTNRSTRAGLAGLRVLALESRRAQEMSRLIAGYGGQPVVVPSMREVPLQSSGEAQAFARKLIEGGVDVVIFLTGVGTRALARAVEPVCPREQFAAALSSVAVVARGPKPVAALNELGVPVTLAVPEPHTWREILRALDERSSSLPLAGRTVAIQEYGFSNPDLLAGLAQRGAQVMRVPVYEWAMPEDTGPLRDAVQSIARGEVDVVLFTTSLQAVHLLRVAAEMNLESGLRRALARTLVGSIGPVTSEVLEHHGVAVDFEPAHPKMGFLVAEAAQRASALLEEKRARAPSPGQDE